jgi:hypothetical protein
MYLSVKVLDSKAFRCLLASSIIFCWSRNLSKLFISRLKTIQVSLGAHLQIEIITCCLRLTQSFILTSSVHATYDN